MKDPYIIRKSAYRLFIYAIFSIALLLVICFKRGDDGKYWRESFPGLTIVLILVFLAACCYFLNGLFNSKPEIILSAEGIEFRHRGLYAWEMIHAIRSVQYENSESLFFQINNGSFEIDISSMEESRKEIINLILKYSTNPELHYAGHEDRW
jgi:hypothetical protein